MMVLLAYIVTGITILQLAAAFINLVFREKPGRGKPSGSPLVSVLIPARNEEKNIGNLLKDLSGQDYANIEILVFNDMSEDSTESIVSAAMEKDGRIRLLRSEGLPPGWLGKNHACHTLARSAAGDFLLFLDADVRISGSIISDILSQAQKTGAVLISIFPKQIIKTFGEKITVPNMNYILLSLLPLVFVRKLRFQSMAAANGQFMFFRSIAYKSVYPHELFKANKVEDIATARFMKRKGFRVACLTGDDNIRCRMYESFSPAVNGFSKNVAAFFGNSLLLASLFWLVTTAGFVPVLVSLPGSCFVVWLSAYIVTRIAVSVTSEQKTTDNLLYFIPQQIALGLFIWKALINRYTGTFEWKGRNIK